MLPPLLCFVLFISSLSAFAQDSVLVQITGQIMDDVQNKPVQHAELVFQVNRYHTIKGQTDTLGYYQLDLKVPDSNLVVQLTVNATNYFTNSFSWDSLFSPNSKIILNGSLIPLKICWDSFLPNPILFSKGESTLPEDSLKILIHFFESLKSPDNQYILQNRKLEIKVSSSYDEPYNLTKKRLQYIRELIISYGFSKENIVSLQVNKEPLFICTYCDGCHYYFLKGTGVILSRKEFKKLKDEASKEAHLEQRRRVGLAWVNK